MAAPESPAEILTAAAARLRAALAAWRAAAGIGDFVHLDATAAMLLKMAAEPFPPRGYVVLAAALLDVEPPPPSEAERALQAARDVLKGHILPFSGDVVAALVAAGWRPEDWAPEAQG